MNIAKILKYCPKGTELYSTVWGEVKLEKVEIEKYTIEINLFNGSRAKLFDDGSYSMKGECILFPSKKQRNWNQFRLHVKRGDIMMNIYTKYAFIAEGSTYYNNPKAICGLDDSGNFKISSDGQWTDDFYAPASEEAKKELFDKMAKAGYRWNAETLELEKIEPKFKEGDIVVDSDGDICLVSKITDSCYIMSAILYKEGHLIIYNNHNISRNISSCILASIEARDAFFSVLNKVNVKSNKEQPKSINNEYKPFDKVLVRGDLNQKWTVDIFSYYNQKDDAFPYICVGGFYRHCIPYEGNEHLLGTTDSPS